MFLEKYKLAEVEGLLITAGDEAGKLGWSHIVNTFNVLGREASKNFEAKTFPDLFRRIYFPYQNEFEGSIESEVEYLGYCMPIWMSNDKDKVHVSGNSNEKYGRYITIVNKTGSAP